MSALFSSCVALLLNHATTACTAAPNATPHAPAIAVMKSTMFPFKRDGITQGYESGTVTLQTTQLGAASVRFAKHKTKPKAVLVTRVRNNQDGDDRARIFNPIVWDITATDFQVRFWRLDTHNWAESWPLTFSYLAIW